jgi:predicted alpha/beta hydrolase family esterase
MDNSTHKVLFIQGGGEGVHDDWDGKLAESLRSNLGSGYSVVYPRMPDEADPRYESWKATLCDELATLGKRALLVGHSVGGTILIKAVAESPPRSTVDGIFLIAAPFVGEGGWISEELELPFELGARISESTRVYLYYGSEDTTVSCDHADLYARAIPHAVVRRLADRDHQLNDDLSEVAADIRGLQ